MSEVQKRGALFGDDEAPRENHSDAEVFLESLPRRLRVVRAREEMTRDSLPRRGNSTGDPQLSAAAQRVWDAEKRTAAALAAQYRALAALHELDGSYEEAAELDDVDPLRAALALRVTKNAASWQLRDAHQAVHLFPRALEMLESGAMPSAWFQKMLKSSRPLNDSSRRNLDIAVQAWSMDIPAERFFTLLSALIDLLEHREEKPHPSSRLERSARLLPGHEPGTGILQIVGPIPEILSRWKTLDEAARAIQTAQRTALREGTPIPHDPDGDVLATGRALPLTQLRYLLMSLAELDLEGVEVPTERFRLNITVPVLTLLGASDEPGTLDGTTPLPPSMARSLAGSAQVWHRVLTEPTSGAFLPLPADRYVPTASMLEHLRLRNSLCAVPGCTRSTSWASECDHIEECRRGTPGTGALTEVENLHLLCWQHHLDKTNGLLDPTRLPTGPAEPGRSHWRIGSHGDAVTVIDEIDTASIQMAEDLTLAWTCFLRGTHAGNVATPPVPAGEEPFRTAPPLTGGRTAEPPPPPPPDLRPPSAPPPRRPSPGDEETSPDPWGGQGPPPF